MVLGGPHGTKPEALGSDGYSESLVVGLFPILGFARPQLRRKQPEPQTHQVTLPVDRNLEVRPGRLVVVHRDGEM